MENKKQENLPNTENNKEQSHIATRKMTMEELCKKLGIPYVNETEKMHGKSALISLYKPKAEVKTDDEITDSWGAFTHYANQRKGS